MEPEGVAVGFALDQNHHSRLSRIGETVKAIEAGFGPRLPAEAITFERDAKPDRYLFATYPEIRNAHCGLAVIGELRQSAGLEEVDRQPFRARVIIESQASCSRVARGSVPARCEPDFSDPALVARLRGC